MIKDEQTRIHQRFDNPLASKSKLVILSNNLCSQCQYLNVLSTYSPQLLGKIKFQGPVRYPRFPITLLHPPLPKSIVGKNSTILRLCILLNCCSTLVDIHTDSLNKYRKNILNTAWYFNWVPTVFDKTWSVFLA